MCDRPTLQGKTHDVCQTPFGLDGFIPITQYADPISSLTKIIKYDRVRDAATEVYKIFSHHWPEYAPQFDLLIPMPIHPRKLRMRGFNQAELFAREIGIQQKIPVSSEALIKIRETVAQASLKRRERKLNLQQGFVCLRKSLVQDRRIGLVDDVATTCTTLKLAGEVLKKAGAKEVWGVVLAHRY